MEVLAVSDANDWPVPSGSVQAPAQAKEGAQSIHNANPTQRLNTLYSTAAADPPTARTEVRRSHGSPSA